jgi:hypothetical protein
MPVLVPAFLHAPPSVIADTTQLVPTTVDTTNATTTATRFMLRDIQDLLIHAATPPRSVKKGVLRTAANLALFAT